MMRAHSSPRGLHRGALARARRGFALPIALLLVVLLTILAASSLAFVGAEQRSANTQIAQIGATAVARSGMERYLADRAALGNAVNAPAVAESAHIVVSNGYADVLVSRVRDGSVAGGQNVYLISSHGVMTDSASGRILAERTVAQYARWQDATMSVLAAWTSYTGITKPDALGLIDGDDACGSRPAVAGAAVPAIPGLVQPGAGGSIARGVPPVLTLGVNTPSAGITSGSLISMVADGGMPGSIDLSRAGWPEPSDWSDPTFWPTLIAPESYTLGEDGRGVLIVAGNLYVTSTRAWSGILIVGGNIIVTGDFSVDGAIVSGISLAGAASSPSMAGAGDVTYRYNSCAVASALSRFRGLTPYRNATIDNWPTY